MFELFGIIFNIASVILFIAGMVLLLIEMFMPGFGIFGGLGLLALVLCIILQAKTLIEALIMVLIIGAVVALLWFLVLRSLKKGVLYKSSIVLKDTADKDKGFVSNADYSRLVGRTGTSITVLRPSGIAEIDGEKVDVVTDGEFLQKDTIIEVREVTGRRVLVRQTRDIEKRPGAGFETPGNTEDI